MNTIDSLQVNGNQFGCVPKDMKRIVVTCKTQQQAMEAFKTGKFPADAAVTRCNFDWQNDLRWIAHTTVLWETT